MRALVIDDSRATRAILGRILAQLGFEVAEAADGQQGLDWLGTNGAADLALVDWNMPVLDGLEFVRAVRSQDAYAPMRVVMVTTEANPDRMVAALEAGADEYAMKPFTSAVIRDKLEMLGVAP